MQNFCIYNNTLSDVPYRHFTYEIINVRAVLIRVFRSVLCLFTEGSNANCGVASMSSRG